MKRAKPTLSTTPTLSETCSFGISFRRLCRQPRISNNVSPTIGGGRCAAKPYLESQRPFQETSLEGFKQCRPDDRRGRCAAKAY
jgi:hypothetical protein